MDWEFISENITYSKLYGTSYDNDIQHIIDYFDAVLCRNVMKNKNMKNRVYFRDDVFYVSYLYTNDSNVFFYDDNLIAYAIKHLKIDNKVFDNMLTWYILEYTHQSITGNLTPRVRKFTRPVSYAEFEIELDDDLLDKYIAGISNYSTDLDKIENELHKNKLAALNAVLNINITDI